MSAMRARAQALDDDEGVADWLLAWAELETSARVLADGGCNVLWANEAARALLRTSPDLRLVDEALHPTDPGDLARLNAFVAKAGPVASAWCLGCADGDGGILFQIWRVSRPDEPPVVGLKFHTTGSAFGPQWADIGTIFGLTGSESAVVRGLLDGLIAERVAERLGISLETVRSHIRHAYRKLGVCSREELFRKTAPYRLV